MSSYIGTLAAIEKQIERSRGDKLRVGLDSREWLYYEGQEHGLRLVLKQLTGDTRTRDERTAR